MFKVIENLFRNHRKVSITIPIILAVGGVFLLVYFWINGTPWGKAEIMKEVQEYLDQTYKNKKQVSMARFFLGEGLYYVSCYDVNDMNTNFLVVYGGGGIVRDTYYLSYFERELARDFDKYVKEVYGENSSGYVGMATRNINELGIQELNDDIMLADVANLIQGQFYYSVSIGHPLRRGNDVVDAEKILQIIHYVNLQSYKPSRIDFGFYDEKELDFLLWVQEYAKLTDVDEVKRLIKENLERK